MTLLQRSMSAGALILLTALLRRFAGNRLPRRMYVALWDLATLRLLVPFALPWRFSPEALMARALHAAPQTVAPLRTAAAPQAAAWAISAAQETPRAWPVIGLRGALTALWAVGAVALAAYFLCAYAHSVRAFAQSLPDDDPRVSAFLRTHPTRRPVRVRVSGRIAAPLSYGLLRPALLLPKGMNRDNLRAVLAHETAHIRALDAWRKLFVLAALCLHWPNPAAVILFLLVNRDMELLCDERVLCELPSRRAYAQTLLEMETVRVGASPLASSFSMTGIEERIWVMKNMRKKTAASAVLACALVAFAAVALATTGAVQTTGTAYTAQSVELAQEDGNAQISPKTWETQYAKYAPFGLGYDAQTGRLTFDGQPVRTFEDMYPVGENAVAGTVCQFSDGDVDVYAVRDLTAPIERRADGSFDPSGKLIGLRPATPEEFDARTKEMNRPTESAAAAQTDALWWTAEEYAAWMAQEREALDAMAAEGARAYTQADGWFTWTPERVDETMALYQRIYEQIKAGWRVSKAIDGAEEIGMMGAMPDALMQSGEGAQESATEIVEGVGVVWERAD